MIFEHKFSVGLKGIGKKNKITNKALLEMLENIACMHSDSVGFGVNTTEKTKRTWVLLDWLLELKNRPTYGETLKIKTWSRYTNKCYSYRDFEVYDNNNNLCAIATSKWLFIDVDKKRLTKVDDATISKYHPETGKSVFNILELDKLRDPENYDSSFEYEIKRRDIDINNHVHNLYYLDFAYEALPQDVYENKVFDKIRIMYKKEMKLNDKIICYYTNIKNKHIVTIKSRDNKLLHAIIELQ